MGRVLAFSLLAWLISPMSHFYSERNRPSSQMRKKTSTLKSWSKRNLPEELWPEILSCLPVKSLLRFRSVSRAWKAIIDDPDFGRLHLNRFNNRHEPRLFVVQGAHGECVVKNDTTLRTNFSHGFLESDQESPHVLRATPARGLAMRWCVLSSIDGLFLLTDSIVLGSSRVMLWNPSIRKTLTLPLPPRLPISQDYIDFGFGFDPCALDFKFVRLAFTQFIVKSVAIYSLRANSWKSVDFRGECSKDLMFYSTRRPIPLNGGVYTMARDNIVNPNSMKLIWFDLRREAFASFGLPGTVGPDPGTLTTIDQGNTLAMVSLHEPEGSVWVLDRLGDDTESWRWVRRYSFATQHKASELKLLCVKMNGEMLLKWKKVVVCHNLETQQEKVLLDKNKKRFEEGCTFPYMESLILHH